MKMPLLHRYMKDFWRQDHKCQSNGPYKWWLLGLPFNQFWDIKLGKPFTLKVKSQVNFTLLLLFFYLHSANRNTKYLNTVWFCPLFWNTTFLKINPGDPFKPYEGITQAAASKRFPAWQVQLCLQTNFHPFLLSTPLPLKKLYMNIIRSKFTTMMHDQFFTIFSKMLHIKALPTFDKRSLTIILVNWWGPPPTGPTSIKGWA